MLFANIEMPALLAIGFFSVVILIFWGVRQYVRELSRKQNILKKIAENSGAGSRREDSPETPKAGQRNPLFNFFNLLGKSVSSGKAADYSHMRIKFLRAGIRNPNAAAIFWGAKIFFAFFLGIVFLSLRLFFFHFLNPKTSYIIIFTCALLGYYLPDIWLDAKASGRKQRLGDEIPDGLDLLVVCVEAGMGLDAAINRVGDEIKLTAPALSSELKLTNLELRAGKTRRDALKNLAHRTNLDSMKSLVTLLIQADQFGTSIADSLRIFSDSFRTKRMQRAEEIAAKLPVKLIFPLVLFILPSLFIVVVGPAAISIYENLLKALK